MKRIFCYGNTMDSLNESFFSSNRPTSRDWEMKKIEQVLKPLSTLCEFNQKL